MNSRRIISLLLYLISTGALAGDPVPGYCLAGPAADHSRPSTVTPAPGNTAVDGRGAISGVLTRVPEDVLDLYKHLNEQEKRLPAWKDDDEALAAKLIQLEYINETRERFGAGPLRLDIFASRVANGMSMESAAKRYAGHWNTKGEKPYHRYAFAGGSDHVTENAAALATNGSLDTTPEGAVRMMREMYDEFLAEKPPNDGHRKTALDRHHNYIGLGFYTSRRQFRYYEEYIDRYLKFFRVPGHLKPGEETRLSFKTLSSELYVYSVIVYYESFPRPMTPAEINSRGSYSDFTPDNVLSIWPWDIPKYRSGNRYIVPMTFSDEGLYYVHIYLDEERFTGNSASTEGKLQASGVVIRVGG